jgi:hypothetical protein
MASWAMELRFLGIVLLPIVGEVSAGAVRPSKHFGSITMI